MREVLEPLASLPGVRLAVLVTEDGVPIAVQGTVETSRDDDGEAFASIDDSERLNSLAALGTSWLGETARTIAPLSWSAPQFIVLRAARGTLMLMQAPNSTLLVLLEGGIRSEDVRLPMEAAVARMQRVLRGVGRHDDTNQPGPGPASNRPAQPGEPSTTGIPGVSGGM